MHMIHHLMRNLSIVLQDVVVVRSHSLGDLLCHRENFGELVVGDIVEFCAVVFGDDELWWCALDKRWAVRKVEWEKDEQRDRSLED